MPRGLNAAEFAQFIGSGNRLGNQLTAQDGQRESQQQAAEIAQAKEARAAEAAGAERARRVEAMRAHLGGPNAARGFNPNTGAMSGEASQSGQANLQFRQGQAAQRDAKDMRRESHNFSKDIQKSGLIPASRALQEIENRTGVISDPRIDGQVSPEVADKLPGVVTNTMGAFFPSVAARIAPDERTYRAITDQLNQTLKQMSGSAVSFPEEMRNRVAAGMSALATEQDIQDALSAANQANTLMSKNIQLGAGPEVLEEYQRRGGQIPGGVTPRAQPAMGTPQPQQGGALSPQEQAELEQLRQELGQ